MLTRGFSRVTKAQLRHNDAESVHGVGRGARQASVVNMVTLEREHKNLKASCCRNETARNYKE